MGTPEVKYHFNAVLDSAYGGRTTAVGAAIDDTTRAIGKSSLVRDKSKAARSIPDDDSGWLANDKVQVYDEIARCKVNALKDRAIRMSAIGRTVRYVREKLGMTQRAAAEALGVSSVHLSNVERGVTPPSALLISRFAEVYGVDVYVLNYCTGEDEGDVPEGVKQARRKLAEALQRQLAETIKAG